MTRYLKLIAILLSFKFMGVAQVIDLPETNGVTTELAYDDAGDLTSVTLKSDSYSKKLLFSPSLKQPEMLVESLLDLQTGTETITRRVENGYSEDGKLLYQQFFDENDTLSGQMLYHYDALGNRVGLFDHEGNGVAAAFDEKGQCLSKTDYRGSLATDETIFVYDEKGLPLVTEKNKLPLTHDYDDFGRIVAEINPTGGRIEYEYDEKSRLITVRYPSVLDADDQPYQPVERFEYDEKSRVCSYQDMRGETISIAYPEQEGPLRVTYPDGITHTHLEAPLPQREAGAPSLKPLQYPTVTSDVFGQPVLEHTEYDDQCNATTLTLDALYRISHIVKKDRFGALTLDVENRYDGAGNKTLERQLFLKPDGQEQFVSTKWEYGVRGRLERVTEALGLPEQRLTCYGYDEKGQLSSITKPDGTEIRYTYNQQGLVDRIFSTDNTIDYQLFYEQGLLVAVLDGISSQNTSRHYEEDRLMEETLGNALSLSFLYDEKGRRSCLLLPDRSGFSYEWEDDVLKNIHRLKKEGSIRYSRSLSSQRNVGAEGQSLDLFTPCFAESTPRDEQDRIAHSVVRNSKGTQTNTYAYDSRCRLVRENDKHYEYDTLSNRYLDKATTYNALCQLLECNGLSLAYDLNGNLIQKGEALYAYDALGRMTKAVAPDGTCTHYTYDYFNRRLSKRITKEDREIFFERYLYDGHHEIGSVDSKGRIQELRMLGPGIGAEIGSALSIELKGKTYTPIHDHRGSVACLVRGKEAVEAYSYDAFGVEETHSDLNPWRFSSKRFDEETGFIYFGKRYYDPLMARWTTPDPLGFIEGANRYQFVGNDPINQVDLFGGFSCRALWCSLNEALDGYYSAASDFLSGTDRYIKKKLSFEPSIQSTIDEAANAIFGEAMLVLLGYHDDELAVGVHGKGELSDKVRVTAVNGILNIRTWAERNAALLSKTHSDINVHYIFRPTRGWTHDVVKAAFVKFGYASEEARLLANTWKQLIQEMGGVESGGMIVHYAHSIGGADTAIARQFLNPEEQKMIRVISLGSPMVIPHEGFHSVINYMSLRDGIFFLAPLAHFSTLFSHEHNVIYLDTYWGIPIIDHLLNRGSYRTLIETLGDEFSEEFLSCNKKRV